ncbi:uncharacterized protein PRCAT00003707001 [Priceomyces carsonii]|uniref:uncharacterized protein n=1 Tax=Priceomyces carsonii TaxID=28549 RepID=UPI002EDAC06D|nr:unnamed protein product [Priceomyces carsonii]
MDGYSPLFLQQLAPYVKVILEDNHNDVSSVLKDYFKLYDISGLKWDNSLIRNRQHAPKYIIRVTYSNECEESKINKKTENKSEHSVLSPFNPKSDLYPNGILSERWLAKYVEDLPFAVVRLFSLPKDSGFDTELARVINEKKSKCHDMSVKFVAIIVADSNSSPSDDEKRISKLRQLSNLPRLNGLFYLHDFPSTLKRDCDILVSSLLSNIRSQATDFYSKIELKIKERYKKYYSFPSDVLLNTSISLSPKFLETRNLIKQSFIHQFISPNDSEPSLRLLELAYQSIVELLRDNFAQIKEELSPHDLSLYVQFRNLIDVLSFHITRGYFSIEEPLIAFKKHKAHIIIVLDVLKEQHFNNHAWIATQYELLGQLVILVPKTLLISTIKSGPHKKTTGALTPFFGGIYVDDDFSHEVVTHPSLIFLQAVKHLDQSCVSDYSKMDLLLSSEALIFSYKLKLLSAAKSYFETDNDTNQTSITIIKGNTLCQYIDWMIGEMYFRDSSDENIEKAVKYYESCLNSFKAGKRTDIFSMVEQRLAKCYQITSETEKILGILIDLSMHSNPISNAYAHLSVQPLELTLMSCSEGHFLNVKALLVNKDLSRAAHLYDPCITQLVIKSNIDLNVLRNSLSVKSKIELQINEIEVTYLNIDSRAKTSETTKNSLEDVLLKNDNNFESLTLNSNVDVEKISDKMLTGVANLNMSDLKVKIFQFSQPARRTGEISIDSVTISSKLVIIFEGGRTEIIKRETVPLNDMDANHHKATFYYPDDSRNSGYQYLRKLLVRLNGKASHSMSVLPIKPQMAISTERSEELPIILGEEILLPLNLEFKTLNLKFCYKKIVLSPKILVTDLDEIDYTPKVEARVCWDTLKDDEPLDVGNLFAGSGNTSLHKLNVKILVPPYINKDFTCRNLRAVVEIITIVYEGDDDSSESIAAVYDTFNYKMPIIGSPFECDFSILPSYRTDNFNDMPCPFLVSVSTGERNGDVDQISNNIPVPTRLWKGIMTINDLVDSHSIKIENVQLDIKSADGNIVIEVMKTELRADCLIHYFTTTSKTEFSQRNVSVSASATIQWSRNGGSSNEFVSEEWKTLVPLSDPRVLLKVTNQEDDISQLQYIIENPTPRIFMFTTSLHIEDDSGWDFNIDTIRTPFVLNAFPVLPFNRHVIKYRGSHSAGTNLIKLPIIRVFDMNYKVNLPTLPVSENVVTDENVLYLKIDS